MFHYNSGARTNDVEFGLPFGNCGSAVNIQILKSKFDISLATNHPILPILLDGTPSTNRIIYDLFVIHRVDRE